MDSGGWQTDSSVEPGTEDDQPRRGAVGSAIASELTAEETLLWHAKPSVWPGRVNLVLLGVLVPGVAILGSGGFAWAVADLPVAVLQGIGAVAAAVVVMQVGFYWLSTGYEAAATDQRVIVTNTRPLLGQTTSLQWHEIDRIKFTMLLPYSTVGNIEFHCEDSPLARFGMGYVSVPFIPDITWNVGRLRELATEHDSGGWQTGTVGPGN